jgi:predicted transposase YbfD/YdcC
MLDFRGTLMAQLGIKCHHSTAYHLQTDSQAEKLNTAVECYLKVEQFLHPKDWDHFVPLVEFTDITT